MIANTKPTPKTPSKPQADHNAPCLPQRGDILWVSERCLHSWAGGLDRCYRFRVHSVRDLQKEPLTLAEYVMFWPRANIARYQITGGVVRSGCPTPKDMVIWIDGPADANALLSLVGLDPDKDSDDFKLVGPAFGNDPESRLTLHCAIRKLSEAGEADYFGIMPLSSDEEDAA